MARYIKANPLVARYLQLENDRNTVSDGNYLFWQNDMLKFGPLTQLNNILVKIGGVALLPHEAREEQDGTVCRPLPMATDARFQQPIKANVNDAVIGDGDDADTSGKTETDQGAEVETPSESEGENQTKEDANAEESVDTDPEPEPSESKTNEKSNK